ncbi:zinc-ribbon domain-containing protein [Aliiroseovarius sp. F20344]|uniref:zinc-ribbon domain-containing protein n=1 Tax=Aliiroseovarius sp. F20344 TaxID=2926414 RepID=UPI001FF55990|nr:zinc-ribbon domain-containing protein [Aliiroseovarius sp. F20344]MCK0144022.1 zinc-ribbon domain-containing protein [Aliiroseovarius sp. F20344]
MIKAMNILPVLRGWEKMRLVCPNCGAQYEVDDRVMPETGRDVQCSNCSHTWFQAPAPATSSDEDAAEDPKVEIPAPAAPEPKPEPELADDAPEASKAPEAEEPEVEDDEDTSDLEEEVAASATPPRTEVSEDVKQILQEEAQQELRAREAEQTGLETQPDLGLEAAQEPDEEELAERIKRMKAEEDISEEAVSERDLKSRDMLPDIEEINSTLDAPADSESEKIDLSPSGAEVVSGRSGFRRGFGITLLLAVLLVALYVLAPMISARFPQAQGVLDQYTAMGDSARLWLEGAMQSAIEKMRTLMATSSEG